MKKTALLLLLASIFTLAGCQKGSTYYPNKGGTYVEKPKEETEGGGGEEGEEDVIMATYNFYFSFSATTKYNPFSNKDEDAPIYSMSHAMLEPLGKVPDAVSDVSKITKLGKDLGFNVDPSFPKFIGFSFNGVCLDEEGLWNFETDFRQLAVVNLYAVWVSE